MGYSIQMPYERLNKNDKAFSKRFRVVIKLSIYIRKKGISDKKRPKMGLFCSYMTKRDLKHLVSLYLQGE